MKLRIVIFLWAFLCIFSASSQAQMFVQTGMDVGRIAAINADHSITLDNHLTYTPARPDIALNALHAGEVVSINYTVGAANSRMYFEVKRAAKNARSQPLTQPPAPARMRLK